MAHHGGRGISLDPSEVEDNRELSADEMTAVCSIFLEEYSAAEPHADMKTLCAVCSELASTASDLGLPVHRIMVTPDVEPPVWVVRPRIGAAESGATSAAGAGASVASASGLTEYAALLTHFLPPIELQFVCVPSYPSRSPPVLCLRAPWLSSTAAAALSGQLEAQWEELGCSVCLFTWIEWLKTESVHFLVAQVWKPGAGLPSISTCSGRTSEEVAAPITLTLLPQQLRPVAIEDTSRRLHLPPDMEEAYPSAAMQPSAASTTGKGESGPAGSEKGCSDGTIASRGAGAQSTSTSAGRTLRPPMASSAVTPRLIRALLVGGPGWEQSGVACSTVKGDAKGGSASSSTSCNSSSSGSSSPAASGAGFSRTGAPAKGHDSYRDSDDSSCPFALLVTYEAEAEAKAWENSTQSCPVCFEDKQGKDCTRLQLCSHVFCKECVASHVKARLEEGDILNMRCLEVDCAEQLLQAEVKEAMGGIGSGAYDRYEALLLERALNGMSDVITCPRPACQKPANLVEVPAGMTSTRAGRRAKGGARAAGISAAWGLIKKRMGICSYCNFTFCAECRKGWHGTSPCLTLLQQFRDATEEERAAFRKKYGDHVFDEIESQEWMASNTRSCPRCTAPIQKNRGCNHMTCTSCRHEFCWTCGEDYKPGHFSRMGGVRGPCEQFDDEYFQDLGVTREFFYEHFTLNPGHQ